MVIRSRPVPKVTFVEVTFNVVDIADGVASGMKKPPRPLQMRDPAPQSGIFDDAPSAIVLVAGSASRAMRIVEVLVGAAIKSVPPNKTDNAVSEKCIC
jgi:hypothetical protein